LKRARIRAGVAIAIPSAKAGQGKERGETKRRGEEKRRQGKSREREVKVKVSKHPGIGSCMERRKGQLSAARCPVNGK